MVRRGRYWPHQLIAIAISLRGSSRWARLLLENDLPSAVAPTGDSPAVIEAFLWGALAASALLVGALIAYAVTPSQKLIAVVMALGAGLLIGSIAFELIDEALKTSEVATVGAYTLVGAAAFTLGNWWIDRRGGGDRKDPMARRPSPSYWD